MKTGMQITLKSLNRMERVWTIKSIRRNVVILSCMGQFDTQVARAVIQIKINQQSK